GSAHEGREPTAGGRAPQSADRVAPSSLALIAGDLLFYGDTVRSAAMRHELPIAIGDPFLLAIVDGRAHVGVSTIERERVAAALPDGVLHDITDLGFHELLRSGMSRDELSLELT